MTDPDLLTHKAQAPKPLVSATPQFWDAPAATELEFPRFLALQQLCNCPNISIRNCGLWGTQRRSITMKLQMAEMQSLQKTSICFYNNPSEVQVRLLGNPCQKAESEIFLKKNFWEVKLFCQKVSWALHGSVWFGAIISVLGWKYTFYHTRMLITLLSSSQ